MHMQTLRSIFKAIIYVSVYKHIGIVYFIITHSARISVAVLAN